MGSAGTLYGRKGCNHRARPYPGLLYCGACMCVGDLLTGITWVPGGSSTRAGIREGTPGLRAGVMIQAVQNFFGMLFD